MHSKPLNAARKRQLGQKCWLWYLVSRVLLSNSLYHVTKAGHAMIFLQPRPPFSLDAEQPFTKLWCQVNKRVVVTRLYIHHCFFNCDLPRLNTTRSLCVVLYCEAIYYLSGSCLLSTHKHRNEMLISNCVAWVAIIPNIISITSARYQRMGHKMRYDYGFKRRWNYRWWVIKRTFQQLLNTD